MGQTWFQFQQFKVHQDQCAMKISTDAVLMGGLVHGENPHRILDVGTGTGVIALMLAQRYRESFLTAVELDEKAAEQAKSNFKESPFSNRMKLWKGEFQSYQSDEKFDMIVSNPPYFPDHLKAKDSQRNQALHTDALSFKDLVVKASSLITEDGNFWVILPPRQMQDFIQITEEVGFHIIEKLTVQDKPGKKVLREIVCFSKKLRDLLEKQVFIKNEDGSPHMSYQKAVAGFLLEFN